jgi:hypothetical protein
MLDPLRRFLGPTKEDARRMARLEEMVARQHYELKTAQIRVDHWRKQVFLMRRGVHGIGVAIRDQFGDDPDLADEMRGLADQLAILEEWQEE